MAVTVGGTSITFNDGTVQSTAAGAVTTTAVLNATAAASVGAVGSYAFLFDSFLVQNATRAPGSTLAGSSLRYSGAPSVEGKSLNSSTSPAGTWRLMGYSAGVANNYGLYDSKNSLWLRIS